MIEELLQGSEQASESKKFYGVTAGRVINPLDPLMLGRLQVQLPFLDGLDLSPWARVAVPMSGQFHGFYFLPKLGDEVLVAFEHGDVNAPYIIGSLWNAVSQPPMPSPVPQIRALRTPVGNQLVFTEAPPTVTLQNGPTPPVVLPAPPTPGAYQSIVLNPAGILMTTNTLTVQALTAVTITVGGSVVTITPDGVTISSGGHITFTAGGAVNITAGAACNITAPMVKIN